MNWQRVSTYKNLDLAQFQELARKLKKDFGSKAVIALSGPMAAGKTEFVKTISDEASSPTFAIHQSYGDIEHLDLYRLTNEDELESTGFWDLFLHGAGLIFIEWPEKMDLKHIPISWPLWKIVIEKESESLRKLEVFIRL